MAEHPNVALIRDGYAAFAEGDLAAIKEFFAEDIRWHETGRNQIAGEYVGIDAVFGLFGKLLDLTGGTLSIDVHAALADDDHGVALVVVTASRGGQTMKVNGAHVMHMRDGKVVEFWNASPDQYAVDELFA